MDKNPEETGSGGASSSKDIGEVVVNQEDEYVIDDWAVDDITGKTIELEKVNEARKEEIGYMKELGVFEK